MATFVDENFWEATLTGKQTKFVESVKDPTSPSFVFANDGSQAMRTLWVKWDDLPDPAIDLLGYPTIANSPSGVPYVSRVLPDAISIFVNSLGNVWLYATNIPSCVGNGVPLDEDMKDVSTISPIGRYRWARLEVVYESLTYDIVPDTDPTLIDTSAQGLGAGNPDDSTLVRYVTKVAKPAAEYLTLAFGTSGAGFKMVEAGHTAWPGTPGKIVPAYDLSLTWHQVPKAAVGSSVYNPTAASFPIDNTLGCVNLTSFMGFPQGTLLLTAADIRPVRSAFGDRIFDIEYRIRVFNPQGRTDLGGKPIGHNHVYWPGTATPATKGYYELSTDGTTNLVASPTNDKSIYNFAEFRKLFRVPQ